MMQLLLYLSDGLLRSITLCESDEGISSIQPSHWVHHESEIPNGTTLLKQWNQLVFIEVSRYLATKYLKVGMYDLRYTYSRTQIIGKCGETRFFPQIIRV